MKSPAKKPGRAMAFRPDSALPRLQRAGLPGLGSEGGFGYFEWLLIGPL
jgi:hypothetical protein